MSPKLGNFHACPHAGLLIPDFRSGQVIVVYCANTASQNSRIAAQTLASMGYTNVAEYEEGKQDWIEAGLPVESDQEAAWQKWQGALSPGAPCRRVIVKEPVPAIHQEVPHGQSEYFVQVHSGIHAVTQFACLPAATIRYVDITCDPIPCKIKSATH